MLTDPGPVCDHCLRYQTQHEGHKLCEHPTRLVPSGRIAHVLTKHADCEECDRGRVPVEYQTGWPWKGEWTKSHIEPWHVQANCP